MNTWVNMTPHRLTIRRDDGSDVIIPPCNEVLRVDTDQIKRGETDGIRINAVRPSQSAIEDAMETSAQALESEGAREPVRGHRVRYRAGLASTALDRRGTGEGALAGHLAGERHPRGRRQSFGRARPAHGSLGGTAWETNTPRRARMSVWIRSSI